MGKYTRIDVRFRAQFCYIDAYKEPYVPADLPPPGFPGMYGVSPELVPAEQNGQQSLGMDDYAQRVYC